MMRNTLYFFRHGESEANAGQATTDVASIDLTALGVQQAKDLARFFPEPPQRAIASPFLRARKTAKLALAAYPDLAIDIWPIQEFTYLSPEHCAGTTTSERLAWVADYWRKADPWLRESPEVESFADLIQRVDAALHGIRSLLQSTEWTAMFGHAIFMKALRCRAENEQEAISGATMRAYREYALANPIANCSGFRCELDKGAVRFFDLPRQVGSAS
jgi:broad specificity phosphatase PhoE